MFTYKTKWNKILKNASLDADAHCKMSEMWILKANIQLLRYFTFIFHPYVWTSLFCSFLPHRNIGR